MWQVIDLLADFFNSKFERLYRSMSELHINRVTRYCPGIQGKLLDQSVSPSIRLKG
jgi:hypothetical protein